MFLQFFVPFARVISCRSVKDKINRTIERKRENNVTSEFKAFALRLILIIEEVCIEQIETKNK